MKHACVTLKIVQSEAGSRFLCTVVIVDESVLLVML